MLKKQEAIEKLMENGCVLKKGKEIEVVKSECGERSLHVAHIGNSVDDVRCYMLFERLKKTGEAVGMFNQNYFITASDIGNGSIIDKIVLQMYGDYMSKREVIKQCLMLIEYGRVLEVDDSLACDKMSAKEVIAEVKEWMLRFPMDNRFSVLEINHRTEIVIKSGANGFDALFKKIAPGNDIHKFKQISKKENLIKTNVEPARYTYKIEYAKAKRCGLESNQVILINFDDDRDFVEAYLQKRKELQRIWETEKVKKKRKKNKSKKLKTMEQDEIIERNFSHLGGWS